MAMSESRRRKLEILARSIARGEVVPAEELLRRHGHTGVNRRPREGERIAVRAAEPIRLEDACRGVEATVETRMGRLPYYLIRRGLDEVAPDWRAIASEYAAVLKGARQRFDELAASAALCRVADGRPEDLLFLDTETCGFSGTVVFLVGMMSWRQDRLVFEQCLARDYSQEAAVLQAFAERYAEAGVLVTFNGKAFDMTMIRERSAFHGVELSPREPPHLDLLHEARKLWRRDLPNCRLATLERHICRRQRSADIPGGEIPDAYHEFVATGDARLVADIVHHNLLDLLTMAQLVTSILTGCGPA